MSDNEKPVLAVAVRSLHGIKKDGYKAAARSLRRSMAERHGGAEVSVRSHIRSTSAEGITIPLLIVIVREVL